MAVWMNRAYQKASEIDGCNQDSIIRSIIDDSEHQKDQMVNQSKRSWVIADRDEFAQTIISTVNRAPNGADSNLQQRRLLKKIKWSWATYGVFSSPICCALM